MIKHSISAGPIAPRAGITLLEVLVACGVLLFAMAGIAAILPAASSRLADSVAEDRAAFLSANVYSEFLTRRIATASILPPPLAAGDALAFGQVYDAIAALKPSGINLASSDTLQKSIWPTPVDASSRRGFFSEDDLEFSLSGGSVPQSVYETVVSGTPVGPRVFKRGVCWGATLVPNRLPSNSAGTLSAAGSMATLSIAAFKKAPTAAALSLTATNGLYCLPAGQQTNRSNFLRPCSYVLVSSTSTPNPPKWFRINSSWDDSSTNIPYISFMDLNRDPKVKDYESSGKLTVIGFSGLIRVDEFQLMLK